MSERFAMHYCDTKDEVGTAKGDHDAILMTDRPATRK